jgi:hypothetical protein
LIMAAAFMLYFTTVVLIRARCEVLARERHSTWVQELARQCAGRQPLGGTATAKRSRPTEYL